MRKKNFYLENKSRFLNKFLFFMNCGRHCLAAAFGQPGSDRIVASALNEYEAILPGLPDIGGERNPVLTAFIALTGWMAALYRQFTDRGKSAEEFGEIFYGMSEAALRPVQENAVFLSPPGFAEMSQFSEWTHRREYHFNWVISYLNGKGEAFDWGYDVEECGALKYLRSIGCGEITPYICLCDFLESSRAGTGLFRTKTLAEGFDVCNFRFKIGRAVNQTWGTEIARIRDRLRGHDHGHIT